MWKAGNNPNTQIPKIWYTYLTEYSVIKRNKILIHATIWMKPKNFTLTGKKKPVAISHDCIYAKYPEEVNYRDRKQTSSCLRQAVGAEISCKQAQGNFWSDRNVLKLDYGDSCTTYKFIKTRIWRHKQLFNWNSYWKLKLHSDKDRLWFFNSIIIKLMLTVPWFDYPK